MKTLSIILPCYNPLKKWHFLVEHSYNTIQKSLPTIDLELVLVNDGSDLNIENEVAYLKNKFKNFNYVSYKTNQGKGYAVRKGAQVAKYDNVIFTDIDFPYKDKDLVVVIKMLLNNEADVIVGARDKGYYDKVPFYRKLISKSLIFFNKILLKLPTGETQVGLKGFSNKGKEALLSTTINGYLFDIELLKIATRNKCLVKTSYVELKQDIVFSKMSISLLWQELKNYFKIFAL